METAQCVAFGTLRRRYRIAAGLTQEELAERAGLSGRIVGDMKRGVVHTPRKDTVALLVTRLTLDERWWAWVSCCSCGATGPRHGITWSVPWP